MTYRRRASPLHAARAAVGCAWCAALVGAALVFDHPLLLAAVLVALVAAGAMAGVAPELARAARLGVPFALVVALINPIVVRDGLTVIARGGSVPILPGGRLDITLEATVYGGVLGLRALALVMCFGLYAAAIDPDEVLRLFRRVSFRSALTATLATRMVPVLTRDGRRLAEAQRCRPGGRAPRLGVVRAVAAGALDRATDVAATLEVRGFGSARRLQRAPRPVSRHDLAFGASAVGLAALAIASGVGGWEGFEAYPRVVVPLEPRQLVVAVAVAACALLPFADRRGIA
jgi:energy-coupling factor transport system permease protein